MKHSLDHLPISNALFCSPIEITCIEDAIDAAALAGVPTEGEDFEWGLQYYIAERRKGRPLPSKRLERVFLVEYRGCAFDREEALVDNEVLHCSPIWMDEEYGADNIIGFLTLLAKLRDEGRIYGFNIRYLDPEDAETARLMKYGHDIWLRYIAHPSIAKQHS